MKDLTETKAQGYKVENGKLVYFSNMLNGYKHEYKDLQEICEEMNGLLKKFNSYEEQLVFWKGKAEDKLPKNSVVLSREEYSDYLTLQDNYKHAKEKLEKLQADNERLYKNIGKFKELTVKETADKLFTYMDMNNLLEISKTELKAFFEIQHLLKK